ncbi:nucleotide exchange factor GrpE [Cetobacterium sp. 2G large]|uniref:nucleotide exchange factor GrpE n=1 Tax=Cetobacterium sp. 2G large TaxID=2759680 RepID=UPI00163CAC16|nr:nucleotide exchange factor GrpE [Cetobacterium sp. 2G large]MBC2853462.1 nucleotide exchange factor GrpE [Cetobacterium sp. 2G large]
MNIKEELRKFTEKTLEDNFLEDNENNLSGVEQNLKKEIKKGTLFVQSEISQLKTEIEKGNKEAETLKKENFILVKELKKRNELLINILQNYFIINTFDLCIENKEVLNLVLKKEKYLLNKDGIDYSAEVGQEFNPKYHEALNQDIEKKDSYTIEKIVEQGYKENGEILKYAKVIIK